MKVTRITQKNVQYFRPLMPDQFLNDKNLLHLGAVSDDDEACAAMSVGVVGPMAYVRWLYTATGLRGQGAATALMDAVTGLISQMNLDGIEIDFDEAEAEDLDSFLTDYGFLVADDRDVYSVPVADVVYGAAIEQLGETELHAGGMHGVSDEAVRGRLIEYVERNGMNPEYLTRLSDEFSVVGTDGDGEVICCILISEDGDQDLSVRYMSAGGALFMTGVMILEVFSKIMEAGRTEGSIRFTDREGRSIALIEKLTGEERETYRVPHRRHGLLLNIR